LKKIFENCFIACLEECLNFKKFQDKFEAPWRNLIQFIFKKYKDGMISEEILDEDLINKVANKFF
jgi:hypothetical protein